MLRMSISVTDEKSRHTTLIKIVLILVVVFLIFIAIPLFFTVKKSSRDNLCSTGKFAANQLQTEFSDEPLLVVTKGGLISGRRKKLFDGFVDTFFGIPYATPPVGPLRFMAPKEVKPWEGTLNAIKFPPNCLQFLDDKLFEIITPKTTEISEDCLYLNVWAPKNISQLKPVLVWIHGGAFLVGSSGVEETDAEVLAKYGDVVVVALNHRLGVLGLLDLRTSEAPGNQGLQDQAMALKWVKENIRNFGGDPEQVTVFGQSSGAISTAFHAISPVNKHLFSRAILQSGSALMPQIIFSNSYENSLKFATEVGCLTEDDKSYDEETDVEKLNDSAKVLQCLKNISSAGYVNATKNVLLTGKVLLTPSRNKDSMPMTPTDALAEGVLGAQMSNIKEVIIGVNNDEASIFLALLAPDIFTTEGVKFNFTKIEDVYDLIGNIAGRLKVNRGVVRSFVKGLIKAPVNATSDEYVKALYNLISDMAFNCPSLVLAEELSKANKTVYFYVFNHRTKGYRQLAEWMGVPHTVEAPFVFGYPLKNPLRFTGADIDVSKRMMSSWSHFARTGEMLGSINSMWPEFTPDKREYLEFTSNGVQVKQNFRTESCRFFRKFL